VVSVFFFQVLFFASCTSFLFGILCFSCQGRVISEVFFGVFVLFSCCACVPWVCFFVGFYGNFGRQPNRVKLGIKGLQLDGTVAVEI